LLDLNAVRSTLETKLKELQTRAAEIDNSLSRPKNADSEERALELEDEQTKTALGEMTDAEIRDIKFALHRIETGAYATCEICKKQIPQDRLLALPWTSKCRTCS
jgi:DnaK suppressor protein